MIQCGHSKHWGDRKAGAGGGVQGGPRVLCLVPL